MHILTPLSRVVLLLPITVLHVCATFDCSAQNLEEIAQLKKQVIQMREESKWPQAMPLAQKLVKFTSDYHGHDSTETADALHIWASLVQKNGDYKRAEQLWLEALAVDEKLFGQGTVQTTRRLHSLANLYGDLGNYERAWDLLKRALVLREQHYGPNHPETATILLSMGRYCANSADYAAAEANLSRALTSFEKAGYSYPYVASTLNAMALVAAATGNHELARQRMLRSIEIVRKSRGPDHDDIANSYADLAMLYYFRREFQRAIPYYEDALAVRTKLFGTNHLFVAHLLSDLGASYLGNGDLALASSALQRAHQVLEKSLGPTNLSVAEAIDRLSQLNEKQGDLAEAKRLCDREYAIKRHVLGSSNYYTLESLKDRVRLSALLGDSEPALSAADSIQQGEEIWLQNFLSFTSERQRLICQQNAAPFRSRFRLWAELGAARPLARAIFRTKGLVLDSLLEDRALAESNGTEEMQQLTARLNDARQRLTQLVPLASAGNPGWEQNIHQKALCEEIESLQAASARYVNGLGRARRALSTRIEDVQCSLPEGTILLEMLRFQHRLLKGPAAGSYGALMVTRRDEPRWVYLGPADDIEKAVKLYQHAVRNALASESLVHSLTELYRQLWAPLLPHLGDDTKRIFISPDGQLNFVSFAALLGPSQHFLGEKYAFSYVSCGRDLTVELPPSDARDLVVCANPDFGASFSQLTAGADTLRSADFRGLDFRPLPWAEAEGRDLHRRSNELGFTNVVLHLGRSASEEQLRQLRSPKVLHLATHGFVLPTVEPGPPNETVASDFSNDSVLRSGLALAGAQSTLELWAEGKATAARNDGILTADDISTLDLRDTWLVVLAACDTGLGEARAGEGVFGLRRGFIQAGAQNLLLTLWPIDDKRTRHLMFDFYTQLQADQNPSLALATVQRRWLKSLRVERGLAEAARIAGPFILSFQGPPR